MTETANQKIAKTNQARPVCAADPALLDWLGWVEMGATLTAMISVHSGLAQSHA